MNDSKVNYYIENKNTLESDKLLFKNLPNLSFKETIVKDFNNSYWVPDSFDVYYPEKENKKEPYLAYSSIELDNLKKVKIIKISNKELIKSLTGFSNFVEKIKISYNDKDKNNYLLCSDWDYIVYLFNLDNNYELKFKINSGYTNYIYSLLIYFKLDYIITSTVGHIANFDYIKIFSLKDGTLIKNIPHSSNSETLYCLIWEKDGNESYIVACKYEKIEIYNLLNWGLYCTLITKIEDSSGDYYFSSFISYNNKYLFTSSKQGYINIWNLYEKNLEQSIKLESSFFKIIPWSIYIDYFEDNEESKSYENTNNYIAICDTTKNGIYIINLIFRKELENNNNKENFENEIIEKKEETFYKYEIISFFENNEPQGIKGIKKIKHPLYGECLLSSGENQNINLWTNNSSLIIDLFKI